MWRCTTSYSGSAWWRFRASAGLNAQRGAALSAATVWALSSYTENFGQAVLEALQASRPVVVSDRVNLADALDKAGAAVVAPAVVDEFARALARVIDDEDARSRLSAHGARFAASYEWAAVAPALVRTYIDAVENSRPARAVARLAS